MKYLFKTRAVKISTVIVVGAVFGYPLLMHYFLDSGQYQNLAAIYLIQFVITQLLLAAAFALTLLPSKIPLITRFAQIIHGSPLPPEVARYCRYATWAWVLFFIALALTSCILYVFSSAQTWSFFCNLLYFPLIAAMFVGEYLMRSYFLPDIKKISILTGWNLFRDHTRSP